ncbi:TetR/AcrR family transcriptional regulator [Nocardia amikacinitolerans]|uniref:TetR/AcrR family transcriptional regulator n=1 Tax=Nocardia amikacinitolerans TaxID=756689 RepID=UPI000832D5B2|nr:TetR family transcriptional regulator [Nocardia amikacinitolerans]
MGNREDLLAGARKAIMERGVAKTTARDIANAAGVSLAAIGYHFGSKDRLITEALAEALGTGIGDRMGELIEATEGRPMSEAFASMIDGLSAVFAANREGMLASLENLLRMARSPESQRFMAESVVEATADLAATLREAHPHLTQPQAEAIGELYFALTQGLSMLWLINDGALPSGATLSTAFAALADGPETAAR